MNGGTFIAVVILSLIVLGAVVRIVKNAKDGRSVSCGGDCVHCAMACRQTEKERGEESGGNRK